MNKKRGSGYMAMVTLLFIVFALSAVLGPSLDGADKVEVKNMVGAAKYMAAREGR